MEAITVVGLTLGWLAPIAFGAVAAAKYASSGSQRPPLVPRPLRWLVWVSLSFATLQAGRAVHLLPHPHGLVLSLAQVVVWTTGLLALVPIVRRVRCAARADIFLARVVAESLPQLTAAQRRAPDTQTSELLETARAAAVDGRGRQALKSARQAAGLILHRQAPGTDGGTALHEFLDGLCRTYRV
ncbi:hypothetical protein ACFY1P_20735 [Streptomyces sp. NPDC001407]|uniref:hypothetical protein n=1 Tax=Streptomyces sp. NPDC001407 TaxID=3364573 RepID=UPI0036909043